MRSRAGRDPPSTRSRCSQRVPGRTPHVTTNSRRSVAAPDLDGAAWTKSSYSGGSEGQCVEVADVTTTHYGIAIRDSKNPSGPALLFDTTSFAHFIADVSRGKFGH
ncbi:DUF397 domain-containing protein [Streptomyces sp. CA-111067]|uniref:DUF397 domain-containing protein n=1 Tax=Streptomyces sp. CA-111067 TaxID=3240046 RepID=UPI003D95AE66